MFRPYADANQSRRNSPQQWKLLKQPQEQWRPDGLTAGERGTEYAILNLHLGPLSDARGELAAPLDLL